MAEETQQAESQRRASGDPNLQPAFPSSDIIATIRPAQMALDLWSTGLQAAWLMAESQSVIGHRMMGMAGLEPQEQDEMQRMVTEKGTAFSAAAMVGIMMAGSGKRPDEVFRAMMHPLRSATGSNLQRLAQLRREAAL